MIEPTTTETNGGPSSAGGKPKRKRG